MSETIVPSQAGLFHEIQLEEHTSYMPKETSHKEVDDIVASHVNNKW